MADFGVEGDGSEADEEDEDNAGGLTSVDELSGRLVGLWMVRSFVAGILSWLVGECEWCFILSGKNVAIEDLCPDADDSFLDEYSSEAIGGAIIIIISLFLYYCQGLPCL